MTAPMLSLAATLATAIVGFGEIGGAATGIAQLAFFACVGVFILTLAVELTRE